MKQSNRYCGRICTALLCAMFLVIWGNSALPGDTSGDISGGIMAWLTELVGGPLSFGELVLRKLAHFTEFTLLGLLLAWRFLLWGQKGIHRFTMPLLCGNLAALMDETIQVFVPGRGPSPIDIWIDTAGVATGITILLVGCAIDQRKKTNHIGGKEL